MILKLFRSGSFGSKLVGGKNGSMGILVDLFILKAELCDFYHQRVVTKTNALPCKLVTSGGLIKGMREIK